MCCVVRASKVNVQVEDLGSFIIKQISWFYICAGHMNFTVMKASTKRGLNSQGLCSRVRIPLNGPSEGLGLNFWIMFKPFRLWEVRKWTKYVLHYTMAMKEKALSSEYKMLQTFQRGMLSLWERVDTVLGQGNGLQRWMLQGGILPYPSVQFFVLSFFVCSYPPPLFASCLATTRTVSAICSQCHNALSHSRQTWKHGTKSTRLWQNTWNNLWQELASSSWLHGKQEYLKGQKPRKCISNINRKKMLLYTSAFLSTTVHLSLKKCALYSHSKLLNSSNLSSLQHNIAGGIPRLHLLRNLKLFDMCTFLPN